MLFLWRSFRSLSDLQQVQAHLELLGISKPHRIDLILEVNDLSHWIYGFAQDEKPSSSIPENIGIQGIWHTDVDIDLIPSHCMDV